MRCFTLWLTVVAVRAWAWPPDWVHDVEPQKEVFVRLPTLSFVEVEDEAIATAEWLPGSNDLMLSGLKVGRTHVLLGAEGKVALWRVRVGQKPLLDEKVFTAAAKQCRGFVATPMDEVKLAVTVQNEACRKALVALFQTDQFEARALEVTFEGPQLQAQLKRFQDAVAQLKAPVTLRYVGAGLVLQGQLSRALHRKVLWALARESIGRLALDDQTTFSEPSDGGTR